MLPLIKDNAEIVFKHEIDIPWKLKLRDIVKEHKVKWLNHPIADLSIIEIFPIDKFLKKRFSANAFPSDLINSSKIQPTLEETVTILGYPIPLDLTYISKCHFSPLFFESKLVGPLITYFWSDKRIKCDFLFLDKPSIQGCSGSGAYISVRKEMNFMLRNRTILFGVVHGTYFDNTGGKLAMITPSFYIWDLLNKL